MAKDNAQDATVPTAQDIMKEITGLSPDQQQIRLNELATRYNVDLRKIMGVNVAFDIVDNTDDVEPTYAANRDMMLQDSGESSLAKKKISQKQMIQ